jgi:MFS family permease
MTADDGSGSVVVESSAWAPLRHRTFRWLWLGALITYVGAWMQIVGAQWLLVETSGSAGVVALVQTATMLPVMLLALPGGVLADVFDRRWVLFSVQVYVFIVAGLLAALTVAGLVTPALILIFTFLVGVGAAAQQPTWQSLLPELVPRTQLGSATRLEIIAINLGRSVGPVLAGVVIAVSGVPAVFALNALSVVFFATALLRWRRPPSKSPGRRERFVPALRAGGRYVWNEPVVRRILLRAMIFIAPAAALWALLPLVARQRLGLGPDGYGALFGALGVGAILAAVVVGRVRRRLSTNTVLGAAGIVYAAALVVVVLVPSFIAALVSLVFAGLAWAAAISTFNAGLQLFLPVWVRARGLAIYLMVFTGSSALASLVWGQVADEVGLQTTFLIAAGVLAASVVAGAVWSLPDPGRFDGELAIYWPAPQVMVDPEGNAGPVLVTVVYTVAPDREEDFLTVMQHLRRSRRRTGADRWELYRDAARPDRFVEMFRVPSWEEHLRQHEGRLTEKDQQIEEAALAFSDPPATGDHLLPP